MKAAMRAKDQARLSTVRLILSAIKQREVDERIQLDDVQVLSVLEKMIKMRKESIEQFKTGGRDDLVARESKEIELLQGYLPAQLSTAEVDALIAAAIAAGRQREEPGDRSADAVTCRSLSGSVSFVARVPDAVGPVGARRVISGEGRDRSSASRRRISGSASASSSRRTTASCDRAKARAPARSPLAASALR